MTIDLSKLEQLETYQEWGNCRSGYIYDPYTVVLISAIWFSLSPSPCSPVHSLAQTPLSCFYWDMYQSMFKYYLTNVLVIA